MTKKNKDKVTTMEERKNLDKQPNQNRAPGEIQGFSKHTKKNNGQGRGQRVKAQSEN
jgi:hypothetical protein